RSSDLLVGLEGLNLTPPDDSALAELQTMFGSIQLGWLEQHLREATAPLFDANARRTWESSDERQRWHNLVLAYGADVPDYASVLTEHLLRFMCHSRWSNGAVATGLAKRAQAPHFRGDIAAILERLKSRDCPASQTVAQKPLRELTVAVDSLRRE